MAPCLSSGRGGHHGLKDLQLHLDGGEAKGSQPMPGWALEGTGATMVDPSEAWTVSSPLAALHGPRGCPYPGLFLEKYTIYNPATVKALKVTLSIYIYMLL